MNNAKSFVEIQQLINEVGPYFGYPNPFDFTKYCYSKNESSYLQQLRVFKRRLYERGANLDVDLYGKILATINAFENYVEQLNYTIINDIGSAAIVSQTLVFSKNTEVQVDYGNGIKIRNKAFIHNLQCSISNGATKVVRISFKSPLDLISLISTNSYIKHISPITALSNLLTVNLSINKLDPADVTDVINTLNANSKINGILSIDRQLSGVVPTTSSILELRGKGWTVTV